MLDATQLYLPLLDVAPQSGPAIRTSRQRAAPKPAVAATVREHRAARLAFLGAASAWALTATEALQLLGEPVSCEAERLERINGVLGARRSLVLIAPEPGRAAAILRQPDATLEGASPLGLMLRDGLPGIARVRAHLVSQVLR